MSVQSEDDTCLGSGKPLHANISQDLGQGKGPTDLATFGLSLLGYHFCLWDGNVSQCWIFKPVRIL
jgi:hypothetical protein